MSFNDQRVLANGNSFAYRIFICVIAILYGLTLAGLPIDVFKDRLNYFEYAQNSEFILFKYTSLGLLPMLSNEPLWLVVNMALGKYLSPEDIVRLFIFIPAVVVAYIVLKEKPKAFFFLLIILFLPQVIKNHIIHLRQGVAIAVFLLGWSLKERKFRWLLFLLTPFIHSSFFFLLFLLVLVEAMNAFRLGSDLKLFWLICAGIVGASLMRWVGELVGARQVESYEFGGEGSGLGFIFWVFMLSLFLLQGRTFLQKHAFSVAVISFYLGTYWLVEVSARIMESAMIIVIFSALSMTEFRRHLFMFFLILYGITGYVMRIDLPWLGFGSLM